MGDFPTDTNDDELFFILKFFNKFEMSFIIVKLNSSLFWDNNSCFKKDMIFLFSDSVSLNVLFSLEFSSFKENLFLCKLNNNNEFSNIFVSMLLFFVLLILLLFISKALREFSKSSWISKNDILFFLFKIFFLISSSFKLVLLILLHLI